MMTEELYKSFLKLIELSQYRSILCLNGDLPDINFFEQLNSYLKSSKIPIIAADGAANQLIKNNVLPKVVIGDLDSIDKAKFKQFKLIHIANQSLCDFQKATNYIEINNLSPSIILGINGGYIDHILNNITIFTSIKDNILLAPPIMGFIVNTDKYKTISLPINTKISLLGAPTANITTTGLKWNLQESQLSFFENNSCFNRTENKQITITVHNGSTLVLVYLLDINDAGKWD